jgi:large subunit ribosomal protein L29
MKATKWREMSEDELTQKGRELTEELFNLRFQLSMGVAKNPSRVGQARRDLARIQTDPARAAHGKGLRRRRWRRRRPGKAWW